MKKAHITIGWTSGRQVIIGGDVNKAPKREILAENDEEIEPCGHWKE